MARISEMATKYADDMMKALPYRSDTIYSMIKEAYEKGASDMSEKFCEWISENKSRFRGGEVAKALKEETGE